MKSLSQQQVRLIEGLALGLIMVLAFFMAGIPHWNYQYPIHSDEWTHYSDAQNLMDTGRIAYPDPFNSGETFAPDIEVGFHLLLGELKVVSGISWLNLFRFIPGIVLALIAFQVYAFGRARGIGLGAAFLVTLIPTTIRVLGPAFLVPVALGLIFIPLTLFILHRLMSSLKGPVILFLLLFSILFIHPPTLAVLTGITVIHLLIFLVPGKETLGWSRQLITAAILVFSVYLFVFFWAPSNIDFVVNEAMRPDLHLPLPPIQDTVAKLGYIPSALSAIGAGILAFRGKRANWAIILSVVSLLTFQAIYPRSYIGPDIIYERGWLYIYVLMAILGGTMLRELWGWIILTLKGRLTLATTVGYTVIGSLVVASLVLSVQNHLSERYYHLTDDATYQDFLWIKEYVPTTHQIGIIEPGKAASFTAVTEKFSYTGEVSPNRFIRQPLVNEFLRGGAKNTSWLVDNGISIVYTSGLVENNQLLKANRHLYLLVKQKGIIGR